MILILKPYINPETAEYQKLASHLARLKNIELRIHQVKGAEQTLTEIYLIGHTAALSIEEMRSLPGVDHVVRVSEEYRILGRHKEDNRSTFFDYQGVRFSQDTLNIFAGLCAVDSPESVEKMMKALQENGQVCTRMGAYKPRTSPYSFQGHGKNCLPYVFELAGKYGIKVIAMEVTHESHLDEIREALDQTGNPTGVMLQIATRNTQNFELLKLMAEDADIQKIIEDGPTSKNYPFHLILLTTKSKSSRKQTIDPLLKYLNNNNYLALVQKEYVNNIHLKMKANEQTILQIDGILNELSTSAGTGLKNSNLVYYNENSQLNDIIKTKDELVREQGAHRIELVGIDKIIKDNSATVNIENNKAVNGKLKFVLPFIFVGLYLLFRLFGDFYRGQKTLL